MNVTAPITVDLTKLLPHCRTQEWWDQFLPGWAIANVTGDVAEVDAADTYVRCDGKPMSGARSGGRRSLFKWAQGWPLALLEAVTSASGLAPADVPARGFVYKEGEPGVWLVGTELGFVLRPTHRLVSLAEGRPPVGVGDLVEII